MLGASDADERADPTRNQAVMDEASVDAGQADAFTVGLDNRLMSHRRIGAVEVSLCEYSSPIIERAVEYLGEFLPGMRVHGHATAGGDTKQEHVRFRRVGHLDSAPAHARRHWPPARDAAMPEAARPIHARRQRRVTADHRRGGLHMRRVDPGHDRLEGAERDFGRRLVQNQRAADRLEAPHRIPARGTPLEMGRDQQRRPGGQGAARVAKKQGIVGMMSNHSGNSSNNWRRRAAAARSLVLTVPSGKDSSAAMVECDLSS